MASRNKDVCRERVVFGFHCRKLGLDITYRHSQSFQCVLKARRTHAVQLNISAVKRQAACGGARFSIAGGQIGDSHRKNRATRKLPASPLI
jgi:hypothetical protein